MNSFFYKAVLKLKKQRTKLQNGAIKINAAKFISAKVVYS
jgi:hypothetical protein